MKKKVLTFILTVSVVCSLLLPCNVILASDVPTASNVPQVLCSAEYWKALAGENGNTVIMGATQIAAYNEAALTSKETNMNRITQMDDSFDATELKSALAKAAISNIPNRPEIYMNWVLSDFNEYADKVENAILTTGFEGSVKPLYGIAVKQTPVKSYPCSCYIGYSATDADDEISLSAINVNEPVIIKQQCLISQELFYYCITDNCEGWVKAQDIAICKDKGEWEQSFQADFGEEDFLVVLEDKIFLEQSVYQPKTSNLQLSLGTILKLVPEKECPAQIAERGTWNNYVVYIPTRNEEGFYEKQIALLPQHCNVCIGYLPMTTNNIIDVAFSCLGNRYGWGGMLGAMDCSLYTRTIYKCFGINMPRNTTWQQKVSGSFLDVSSLSEQGKAEVFSRLLPGTMLYMSGHTMVYLGTVNGIPYAISATGSLADSVGEVTVQAQNSVIVTPLTVRRRNGTTWLFNISGIVTPWTT